MISARMSSPRKSVHPVAYRCGSSIRDFAGTAHPDLAPVTAPEYVSPSSTNIDPDGFSTLAHSAVQLIRVAMNSAGVGSSPICPW
jgi:hypothetical protein